MARGAQEEKRKGKRRGKKKRKENEVDLFTFDVIKGNFGDGREGKN